MTRSLRLTTETHNYKSTIYFNFRYSDPYSMSFGIKVIDDQTEAVIFYNDFSLRSSYIEEKYDLKAVDLPDGAHRVIINASSRFTVKSFVKSDMVKYKLEFWGIILAIVGGVVSIPFLICKLATRTPKQKKPKPQKTRKQDPLTEVQTSLATMLGTQGPRSPQMGRVCPSCGHLSAPGESFCTQFGSKF